jgi:hypothetical protein
VGSTGQREEFFMGRQIVRLSLLLLWLAQAPAGAGPLLESVTSYLDSEAWRYETVAKSNTLRMRYRGQSETWVVLVQAREDLRQLSLYSMVPAEIPADRLDAVGEYLHRANYGLALGCFELDYDTRQVRFRTSVDLEESELSAAQVRNYLYMNVLTCDRYLAGLTQVIEGLAAPRAAVEAVETAIVEDREDLPEEEASSEPAGASGGPPPASPESPLRNESQ